MKLSGLTTILTFLLCKIEARGTGSSFLGQKHLLPRIIGGEDAKPGKFPGIVSLQHSYSKQHFCGGGVISRKLVITAAHCVLPSAPRDILVYAGSYDLKSGGKRYKVAKIFPHPKYWNLRNDIALIQTKTPILHKKVKILKLPSRGNGSAPLGTKLSAIGWGLLKYSKRNMPTMLQHLKVKVRKCRAPNQKKAIKTKKNICIGGKYGVGLCMGDSGTPALIGDDTIIGVVSNGYPCAEGYPDQLTRVASYLPWIYRTAKKTCNSHRNNFTAQSWQLDCQIRWLPKIIGGAGAAPGIFAGIVSLQSAHSGKHFCGGGVISDKLVLTAAHCVAKITPEKILVYAGSCDLEASGDWYEVAQIILHPKYISRNLTNDIALIETKTPIRHKKVKFLKLPSKRNGPIPLGTKLSSVGWGLLKYPSKVMSRKLQHLTVQVTKCRVPNKKRVMETNEERNICIGGKSGIGLCLGDSGTPVLIGNDTIIGVVSYGFPCADGFPDQLTRVTSFLPWIYHTANRTWNSISE